MKRIPRPIPLTGVSEMVLQLLVSLFPRNREGCVHDNPTGQKIALPRPSQCFCAQIGPKQAEHKNLPGAFPSAWTHILGLPQYSGEYLPCLAALSSSRSLVVSWLGGLSVRPSIRWSETFVKK